MKVLQYIDGDSTRCAVVQEDDVSAVDLSSLLAPGEGLPALIRTARTAGRSIAEVVRDLAARSKERLRVDLRGGRVLRDISSLPLGLPVHAPEIWAAGVTYLQSRTAREYESGALNRAIYARVYDADRPEVFLKDADCRRTVAFGDEIFVRGDSSWTVPEPELGLILDATGTIMAYTIGNDMSARDIEADNPLYLPQAKIYQHACALGPVAFVPEEEPTEQRIFDIELRIISPEGDLLFKGDTSTAQMKRTFRELVDHLVRYNEIEDGTVLLTGTGVVPPDDFSLDDDQVVEISVSGVGTLRNTVRKLAR
jgi:2-dehydro-3-deoxy-D-arabinonate dehydratase